MFTSWGISQTKSSTKKSSSSKKKSSSKSKKTSSSKSSSKVPQRQNQPDGERSLEIQNALKANGFLKTEPSGRWDSATSEAFARYQQAHGRKATGKPDARSLIDLGLGAKYPTPESQPK